MSHLIATMFNIYGEYGNGENEFDLLTSNTSKCEKKTNCDDCVGTFSSSSDCIWCTETGLCEDRHTNACANSDQKDSCSSSYYMTIFIIVIAALLFLCCASCILRRFNRRSDGTLMVPLLGSSEDRSLLFRNSLFDGGEIEWMCAICGFDNKPRKEYCDMCGTSREFTADYKTERDLYKKRRREEKKMKKDIVIPSDAQIGEASRLSLSSPMHPSLTPDERREAFNYRRLNQLSLRQKGARRRKMWQRTVDSETGNLTWVRVNFKEGIKGNRPTLGSDASQTSISAQSTSRHSLLGSDPYSSNRMTGGRKSSFNDSVYSAGTRGDSFDATMNSMSPGYTSYLNQCGDLQWEKIESGTRENSKFSLSAPSTNSYAALVDTLVPQDLQTIAAMSFTDKVLWFTDLLSNLQRPWAEGHIRVEVRRSHLLQDSFQQMMMIPLGVDLHKWMRLHFIGEMGIDAGGLEREWFLLVVEQLFDSSTGLFTCSAAGDALAGTYHINPISHLTHQNHLRYFHFAGRLLAKAVMEQVTIPAMLSLPLRKQILSMPITFSDLEFVDLDLYRNLCWLRDTPEGVEHLGLVFAVDYQYGQHSSTYDLKPNGSQIAVTDSNKEEFLELRLRHRMLDSIKLQLEHMLKGATLCLQRRMISLNCSFAIRVLRSAST